MKAKKEITKYNIGGYLQAGLGTAQTIYGLTQLPKARAEFERAQAAAPSLETPSQFYENYRNAYDSELARMETDAIQSNLATSVQALQGAGGRALVGGLTAATRQAQESQNRMLAQERAMRAQAGQQLAIAEERAIGRKEARSQQELAYANQAYQAAVGNIAAGVGSAAEGLMYMSQADKKPNRAKQTAQPETQVSPKQIELQQKEREKFVSESRQMIADESRPNAFKVPELNLPNLTETFMQNKPLGFDEKKITGSPIPKSYRDDQTIQELQGVIQAYEPFKGFQWYNMGGMMTNGAYNHNTNPIDLVQDGQKVGEATGGEYIVNPMQAAAIAKESSYARKLFKRFEKNAKKNK